MLWMEKTLGAQTIRKTYEQFEKQPGMLAVDAAIGGLRKHALDFARHAWNQKPLDPSFVAWDRFPVTPKVDRHEIVQSHLFLAGQHERTANVPVDIRAHARDYRSFTITDDKLRQVTFRNPLAKDPDARVGAILTLRGGATRFEDWSGKETVRMCRDQPDQDVADIVIVYAASDPTARGRQADDRQPGARAEGPVRGPAVALQDPEPVLHLARGRRQERELGHVLRERRGPGDPRDHRLPGRHEHPGVRPGQPDQAGLRRRRSRATSACARPRSFAYTLSGCDDDEQYCATSFTRPVLGDGNWSFGFSVEAASRTAKDAKLTWVIADPSVGFVDYGPEVCNVSEIWKGMALEDGQQTVPLATLEDTEPFTLRFQGDKAWSSDQSGKAAVITYDWTYEVTLQRVDEQGRPL